MATCKTCSGKGSIKCPRCKGSGRVDKGMLLASYHECSHCSGSGVKKCGACNGKGHT
jgi:DnaJ-class molecular chaperone